MRTLGLLVAAVLAGPASAAQLAGTAVEVNPNAKAEFEQAERVLLDGSELFMGERVITTASGQVQIVFTDETHLVVGPNSALVIQQYLLRNDQSVSRFTIDALGGTFRFITGDSDKNAYQIRTPTGTIGVRGTAFDLEVFWEDGQFWDAGDSATLLYEGGTDNCANGGNCVHQNVRCEIGLISKNKTASIVDKIFEQQAYFDDGFIYVDGQRHRLQSEFWVENPSECRPRVDRETTASINPPPPPPPVEPPPPPVVEDEDCNNGRGNGAECNEGDNESGNPGGKNDPPPGHCRNQKATCE